VRGRVAAVLGALALCGCGARAVDLPDLSAVTAPTVAPRPVDVAASAQLGAIQLRDTGGLPPAEPSAAGGLVAPAFDALRAQVPAARDFERISVYDDSVYFTFADPAGPGRSVSATYSASDGLRVFDPQPSTDDTYPLDGVDAAVPGRLVAGIERRFPTLHATDLDLRRSLSYGFGLVWYVRVQDARGQLATVFADLDGTVVAVDTV
jgi:hypothetical protein